MTRRTLITIATAANAVACGFNVVMAFINPALAGLHWFLAGASGAISTVSPLFYRQARKISEAEQEEITRAMCAGMLEAIERMHNAGHDVEVTDTNVPGYPLGRKH